MLTNREIQLIQERHDRDSAVTYPLGTGPTLEDAAEIHQDRDRLLEHTVLMKKALQDLLRGFDELMPGIGAISVQDFANLNDAPRLARRLLLPAGDPE